MLFRKRSFRHVLFSFKILICFIKTKCRLRNPHLNEPGLNESLIYDLSKFKEKGHRPEIVSGCDLIIRLDDGEFIRRIGIQFKKLQLLDTVISYKLENDKDSVALVKYVRGLKSVSPVLSNKLESYLLSNFTLRFQSVIQEIYCLQNGLIPLHGMYCRWRKNSVFDFLNVMLFTHTHRLNKRRTYAETQRFYTASVETGDHKQWFSINFQRMPLMFLRNQFGFFFWGGSVSLLQKKLLITLGKTHFDSSVLRSALVEFRQVLQIERSFNEQISTEENARRSIIEKWFEASEKTLRELDGKKFSEIYPLINSTKDLTLLPGEITLKM